MPLTEHYDLFYLDADEEISEFPGTWDYTMDKIDKAIHDASTADKVAATRITGTLAAARIPSTIARTSATSELENRIKELETGSRSTGLRNISELMTGGTGSIFVGRTGDLVEINFYGITADGAPQNSLVKLFDDDLFPYGFRPRRGFSAPVAAIAEKTISASPRVYVSGGRVDMNNPGSAAYGQFTFTTGDPWPSTLPGSPA